MLGRQDVERIIENAFKELELDVKDGDFTNPNKRTIVLKYKGNAIASTWFDVVQTREYEG